MGKMTVGRLWRYRSPPMSRCRCVAGQSMSALVSSNVVPSTSSG